MAKASPGMKLDTTIWSVTGPWGARIDVTRGAVLFHILFVAILTGNLGLSVDAFVYSLMFALAVLWHEWGHEWSARRQGLEVQRVALTFGGGFCETGGGDVRRVFWVVLMGPLASIALAVLSLVACITVAVYMVIQGIELSAMAGDMQLWMWLLIFALINFALAVFNMFPFQPLDGGKLVHLGLSFFLHQDRARLIAGCVGLAFGMIWVPVMVWMLSWGLIIPVFPKFLTHWRMIFGSDAGPTVMDIKPTPEPA